MPKPAIGHVACYECGRKVELREQNGGRFYSNCDGRAEADRKGCGAHHRYSTHFHRPDMVPGFKPLDAEPRNVTEPEAEAAPEPVTETKEKEGVTDAREKDSGSFAQLFGWG